MTHLHRRFIYFKDAVRAAREEARREGLAGSTYVKSRGTFLATSNKSGQCQPCPEAEALPWDGTKRELDTVVAKVANLDVDEVYVAGGFDGGENFRDLMTSEDYDPWVSEWSVVYWSRNDESPSPTPGASPDSDEADHGSTD